MDESAVCNSDANYSGFELITCSPAIRGKMDGRSVPRTEGAKDATFIG